MRILHYTLGLPPYRSGGLTIYTEDLMKAQSSNGHCVFLLYPGDISLAKKHITKNKCIGDISVYEIKNPDIVPLFYGIKNPQKIFDNANSLSIQNLNEFYEQTRPDIFHIHTMMGLPYELVSFLKAKKTPILYTPHDYFGICLRVNLIQRDSVCSGPSPKKCAECNQNAPNALFLRVRNLKVLSSFKKYSKTKVIQSKKNSIKPSFTSPNAVSANEIQKYDILLKHYQELFQSIDFLLFNSSTTSDIYLKHISQKRPRSVILPISLASILDNRQIRKYDKSTIHLGFIGNLTAYKGFPLLKETLLSLQKAGITNWTLDVWGNHKGNDNDSDKIHYRGKYTEEQRSQVFEEMDLLILPAIWYETFGLIVLEALSYGIPVLVSSTVGAKDIVKEYDENFIFTSSSSESLFEKLRAILENVHLLQQFNKVLLEKKWDFSFDEHVKRIEAIYESQI